MLRLTSPFIDNSPYLKTIKTPTLIIWGDNDDIIPVALAQRFHKELPNNELVILENMGHISMEEAPELVAPLVEEFIKE